MMNTHTQDQLYNYTKGDRSPHAQTSGSNHTNTKPRAVKTVEHAEVQYAAKKKKNTHSAQNILPEECLSICWSVHNLPPPSINWKALNKTV